MIDKIVHRDRLKIIYDILKVLPSRKNQIFRLANLNGKTQYILDDCVDKGFTRREIMSMAYFITEKGEEYIRLYDGLISLVEQ
jgi:predicted transcriptional regulator